MCPVFPDQVHGFDVLHRVLLALLMCLALLLLVGCSGDPECFAVPFLPKCFDDDDDEEKKPDNTAPQATSSLVTPPWLREQTAPKDPLRWCGMKSTVHGM
jgi:hypothetical protein